MRNPRSLLVVLALAGAAACAKAGGEEIGGEVTPTGQGAITPGVFTPPDVDAGLDCVASSGSKWSELYRDIFGPTGRPGSCSFQSFCHGMPGGDDAHSHLECFSEDGCRQSMAEHKLAVPGFEMLPQESTLYGIMRHRNTRGGLTGIMPQRPDSFIFPQPCMDRVEKWIAAGVPAD